MGLGDPSDPADSEIIVQEEVSKWSFSALCEQKVVGWKSPEFNVTFIVEGNNEAEAYTAGQKVMALGYFDLKYKDVKLVKLKKEEV